MIFLFEDKSDQALSMWLSWVLGGYGEVIFTAGNSGIRKYISKLEKLEEDLLIFLDVPYDSRELRNFYQKLLILIKDKDFRRAYVYPIPCMEHYMLKAFGNTSLFWDKTLVDICLLDKSYRQYFASHRPEALQHYRTFERFCKYAAVTNIAKCASLPKGPPGSFYLEDCLCKRSAPICEPIQLKDKVDTFLGCIPVLSQIASGQELNCEDLAQWHRQLVSEHNDSVRQHVKLGDLDLTGSSLELGFAYNCEVGFIEDLKKLEYMKEEDKPTVHSGVGKTTAFSDM